MLIRCYPLSKAEGYRFGVVYPFVCLSVLSHNYVTNRWNFMELTLNIYDNNVVMHMKFHRVVISYRGIIAL